MYTESVTKYQIWRRSVIACDHNLCVKAYIKMIDDSLSENQEAIHQTNRTNRTEHPSLPLYGTEYFCCSVLLECCHRLWLRFKDGNEVDEKKSKTGNPYCVRIIRTICDLSTI